MDRKKLIKLGISVLAVNALGAVAVYKYPELTHVPTVYAEEVPGEDEEIPDAAEAQAATNFKNQMDEFEKAINEFNPDDSDTKESLQYALEDAEGYHTTAVNAIKSEEGKKGFAKYEARYQALKAKAQALLNGESPKPQPEITTQDVTVKEPILYGSSTVKNPALPKGTRNTKVQGVNGEKEVTYTITLTDGKETGRVKKSETVIKPAVDEVIEEGTGPVITTKEETKTEEVDFQVKEVPNPALPEGVRNVTTPGKKGVRTIVETVTYTDGVETGRVVKSNTITTPAVDEVVEVGTKKTPVITTKEETKTEEVDFQVKEVPNPALPEGVRNVTTPGKKGVRTIVYTVTYADGVETGRVEKSNTITTPAVDEVVEVGTKKATAPVVTTENVTETQVIYHGTISLSNPDLPKGTKQIKIAGVDGEKTVVYTVTKTNGVETSRVVRDEQITKTPITQVVEIGTKESGSSQSNASQDQKDPSDKAQDSKGQAQKDSTGKVQDPKDQAKPGSDAATSSQSGQTDRPQQPQYSRVNRNAEEKKNLPNTGEHANGLAALLGLVLASVTAFFNFRRKKH